MVLAEKPQINDDSYSLDPTVLDELITHLSTLASIYHKPPSTFITGRPRVVPTLGGGRAEDDMEESDATLTSDMMMGDMGGMQVATSNPFSTFLRTLSPPPLYPLPPFSTPCPNPPT